MEEIGRKKIHGLRLEREVVIGIRRLGRRRPRVGIRIRSAEHLGRRHRIGPTGGDRAEIRQFRQIRQVRQFRLPGRLDRRRKQRIGGRREECLRGCRFNRAERLDRIERIGRPERVWRCERFWRCERLVRGIGWRNRHRRRVITLANDRRRGRAGGRGGYLTVSTIRVARRILIAPRERGRRRRLVCRDRGISSSNAIGIGTGVGWTPAPA